MRYLLPLLFAPSAVFAVCPPGVNLGHWPISSGNPVCSPYSGSSLGGCFALCEGSTSGGACIELPNANPPTRGPYFTNGKECKYENGGSSNGGNGNSGGNENGEDGTHTGANGLVDVGKMMIGDKYTTDLGVGFNAVSNTVNKGTKAMTESFKTLGLQLEQIELSQGSKYFDFMKADLARIAQNTSGPFLADPNNAASAGYLKSINEKTVLDAGFWNDNFAKQKANDDFHMEGVKNILNDINSKTGGGGGNGGDGSDRLAQLLKVSQGIEANTAVMTGTSEIIKMLFGPQGPYFDTITKMNGQLAGMGNSLAANNQLLSDISGKLDKIGEGSGGGEGGDKPCKGPLCDFTKPSGSSGSALSKVFSAESIDEVKKQVENKDTEITAAMNDVKSVFAPEQLAISGTYSNDYHDINGARVDLSGKSNMELFFNSGPKMVIWFLAVLIAFSILMGGRKNA